MMKRKLLSLLVLLMTAATGAWAQEQSETIATTSTTVNGTHFTITSSSADGNGMHADAGITVTAKSGEYIHKVVITCDQSANSVTADNTTVSSGTKAISGDDNSKTITVTGVYADNFTFTCSENSPQFKQFVVYYFDSAPELVTGIALNKTSIDLDAINDTETLTATVSPGNATYKTVKWSSSNKDLVTVSANGVVTAKAIGSVVITATATNGTDDAYDDVKASCVVTVGKIFYRMGSYNGEYVDWFVARSNTTNGLVMLSKYVLKDMKFGSNSTYTQSNIYKWLDADAGGTFEDELGLTATERGLVKTVDLTNTDKDDNNNGDGTDRFILPRRTGEQPNGSAYTKAFYINDKSTLCSRYWLREKRSSTEARVINTSDEVVEARYGISTGTNSVRPMFYMDTDALAALTTPTWKLTGSGTEDDPYVIEPRYDMTLNVTPSGKGTVTATATRNDITIFNAGLPNKMVAGAVVTLTATPNNGYSVKNITVTSGGTSVALTGEGNIRTFTMPAADVTVEVEMEDLLTTDSDGAYLISSNTDWEYFCAHVKDGITYSGKTVKLTQDISGVTTMAGTGENVSFQGTFDGQGHTLTLALGSADSPYSGTDTAPFRYTKNATIQNLKMAGNIYVSGPYAGGIIRVSYGTANITNCRVSTVIHSSYKGAGYHGGLVSVVRSGTLTITGCVFDGRLFTTNATTTCGGLVGNKENSGTVKVNNSLYAPNASIAAATGETAINSGTTLSRNGGTFTNTYYTQTLGTAQGKQARTISAGTDVTSLAISGTATEYNVSGITSYGTDVKGLKYNDVYYAGNGDEVSLTLAHSSNPFSLYTVTGGGSFTAQTETSATLTMTAADQTVVATYYPLPTEGSNYTIGSKADWETFCTWVSNGLTFSGKTVKLTADITDGVTTRTSNNIVNPFSGTFDGQGHTLKLNINVETADQTAAPFGYINEATIKDLHITGSETTAGMRPASIAGFAKNSTITNCWSEVALSSSKASDIDCGAIVARTESSSTVTLNGCLFTGTITYSDANGYEGGGIVGWARGTTKLNNCVFAPTAFTVTKYQSHNMFIGNASGTINNCYYNDLAAATSLTKQGKQMRTISAGDDVTSLAISGTGTVYNVSGITSYGTDVKGLKYNDVYYAGNGDEVSLTLSHADAAAGYAFSQYTVTGGGSISTQTETSATLTMTDANQTISAAYTENTATLAESTDNATWITDKAGDVYDITLERTLQTGGWNTFSVPFNTAIPSGWTVKELTGASYDDGTKTLSLTFGDAENGIEAGKPYLVNVGDANVVNPTFNDVEIVEGTTATTISGVVEFVPAINPTALPTDDKSYLFVSGGNKLTWAKEGDTMYGFRAYFHLDNSIANARAFSMSFGNDNETTRIRDNNRETITNNRYYDLQGRRINGQPIQKGVYVVNGKKTVIK